MVVRAGWLWRVPFCARIVLGPAHRALPLPSSQRSREQPLRICIISLWSLKSAAVPRSTIPPHHPRPRRACGRRCPLAYLFVKDTVRTMLRLLKFVCLLSSLRVKCDHSELAAHENVIRARLLSFSWSLGYLAGHLHAATATSIGHYREFISHDLLLEKGDASWSPGE